MILILLSIVCLATSESGFYDVNGVKGLLYGVSEYEDPEIALFQLTAVGAMPVFTTLQMAEDSEDLKEGDATWQEDLVKESLINLQMEKSKVEKGDSNILHDIDMLLHELIKLDERLHTDVHPDGSTTILKLFSSNRQRPDDFKSETSTKIPISSESPETLVSSESPKILSSESPEIPESSESLKIPMSSESPEDLDESVEFDEEHHIDAYYNPMTTILKFLSRMRGESDFDSENVSTSTEIPMSAENPDFESIYHKKKIITETDMYQDNGKVTSHEKWIPKSLNTVNK